MTQATHPLDAAGSVELAVLERSGMIESRHLGAAVVVAADGSVLRELGDASSLIYPRSSIKPLQAIAVLRAGVELADEQLVLASASHAATAGHVAVVRQLLDRAGLDEGALQCPLAWPADPRSAFDARIAGLGKQATYMNCSGKHAAFLLACVHNGWTIDDYLDPSHPLQQLVRSTIEEFAGESVVHTGVDGCRAPLHAVSLRGLATATARVASSTDQHAARLVTAILEHPWALDAPGRPNTVVTERLGLIAKGGAEGVIVMAAPGGPAVALKMLDGSPRATSLVALALLASVGAVDSELAAAVADEVTEPVLGGEEIVGRLRLSPTLVA